MKRLGILFIAVICGLMAACTNNVDSPVDRDEDGYRQSEDGVAAYDGEIIVSGLKYTGDGKPYLTVDNKPILMLGAQLRTDYFIQLDKKGLDELDEYFELAASLNIMIIQVPVSWRDVEPRKNTYTDTYINKMIEYSNKYNLKLELLWFGSYMCGYSVEGYLPDYIINNEEVYSSYNRNKSFDGWLGEHYWLIPDNDNLIERENLAIAYMMKAIWEYDRMHGGKRTVIGIQIQNEPDMLATRHTQEGQPLHGIAPEDIWPGLIDLLDRQGKVVKDSKYKCYTRVNITTDDYMNMAEKIAATEGIDFVGVDPYMSGVSQISTVINTLSDIEGNFPHIAENGGEYDNNDLLQLLAFSMGAGYEVFEVVTTGHEYLTDWTLRGVYNPDFSPKSHTQRLIDANQIFRDGYIDLVLAEKDNFLAFNLLSNSGSEKLTQTLSAKKVTVKWSTQERGIAYAIERNGFLTVASTKSDIMELSGKSFGVVQTGYYSLGGQWVKTGSVKLKDNKLNMSGGKIYRIEIK